MSYLVEQPPHCDLLRLSLSTRRFVRILQTDILPGSEWLSVRAILVSTTMPAVALLSSEVTVGFFFTSPIFFFGENFLSPHIVYSV